MTKVVRVISGVMLLYFICPSTAWAILPPQFFVQGLSSAWVVIAGGVAIVFGYFLIFWAFLKAFFKKHKRLILYLFLGNIVIAVIIGVIFYWGFYKPLYKSSQLYQTQQLKNANTNDANTRESNANIR